VIPNWDDSSALTILRNTRQAMPDEARLLLFEPVLPEGDEPHITRALDLLMLVVLGGQVRTEAELSRLLEAAGLRLNRVIPTTSPMAVVEAVRT
jgi:O-methyltransferase domain